MIDLTSDEYFMREALRQAQMAMQDDEVPVGVVIVANQKIISRAYNMTERLTDVTAHAEMQAITAAANFLGGKYLDECTMYVTIEPCLMCAGACYWAHLGKLVYGARDEKKGFLKVSRSVLHPKTALAGGVLEKECSILMKEFFQKKRL
jgi:tRNA(adenine34) deaminase